MKINIFIFDRIKIFARKQKGNCAKKTKHIKVYFFYIIHKSKVPIWFLRWFLRFYRNKPTMMQNICVYACINQLLLLKHMWKNFWIQRKLLSLWKEINGNWKYPKSTQSFKTMLFFLYSINLIYIHFTDCGLSCGGITWMENQLVKNWQCHSVIDMYEVYILKYQHVWQHVEWQKKNTRKCCNFSLW